MNREPMRSGYSLAYRRGDGSLVLERQADSINTHVYARLKDAHYDLSDLRKFGMDPVLVRVKFRRPVIVGLARLPKSHL